MAITASQVSELRKMTNCGLMDCKKALEESKGDIQQAVELLRKKGIAKAIKKADRITAEGMIKIKKDDDGHLAIMLEVNCETDFVARDINFQRFVEKIIETAFSNKITDTKNLEKIILTGDKTIEQGKQELIAKLGENVTLRRIKLMETKDLIGDYVHGNRIGSLVRIKGGDSTLAKDIAMHIVASKPIVILPEEVDKKLIEEERKIYMAQAQESGKPQNIIEKIVEGKIKKFTDEVSLYGQPFVKDPNMSIRQLLASKNAQVVEFVRFELGEGIEKETKDFAKEVMKQVKGK